jgi:hypothetical protein
MSSSSHDILSSLKFQPYIKLFGIPKWTQRVPWQILLSSALIYLSLVQLLRFRALHKVQRKYASYISAPYSMPYNTAHEILKLGLLNDFPFVHAFATQWALVKTYGIASGTPLLAQTGRLTSEAQVGRRAEDTAVMIGEFLVGSQDSERGLKAISKMNWLHARYGSRITKPEMMYTLSVFVLEPIRWVKMYEWREMTELEEVALFVYWKEIGNRMGIPNIPDTVQGLRNWAEEYEKTDMYFVEENKMCADATVNLLLRDVPEPLRGLAKKMAMSFMEEKVRRAVGAEDPPIWAERAVSTLFWVRAFMIRHLFLPRWKPVDPLAKPGRDGRLRREPNMFAFEPWYVKDTLWSRFMVWLNSKGRLRAGKQWDSQGYLPEEIGPAEYVKASKKPVCKEAEELKVYVEKGGAIGVGCPFAPFSK